MKSALLLSIFLMSIYGCRSYSITERNNEFLQSKKISKALILPMDFIQKDSENKNKAEKGKGIMKNTMLKAFKKMKLEGVFVEEIQTNNPQDFFEHIVPIKKEILTISELHEDIFKQSGVKTHTVKLFGRAPQLDPKYVFLYEKYNVRYVLFAGIFSDKKQHYQYVILADILRGEIVFRNLKYMKRRAIRSNIEPVFYDTILSINN